MKPSIIFFGTGPVSLQCLHGIRDAFTIEAIITKPDRVSPSGRTHDHPVKIFAMDHDIPLFQINTKQELSDLSAGEAFTSSVGLVVDFGVMIPENVIATFEHGIVNSHFSLLPKLRGADPITFAVLEGAKETGVTLMKIVPALDEGDIIAQEVFTMFLDITTPELTRALGDLSNTMLREWLPRYIAGTVQLAPQDHTQATYTRKLTKDDGIIDWTKPAEHIDREIRAFLGWPGSRTTIRDREIIIVDGAVYPAAAANKNELVMPCGNGTFLEIIRLKPVGKREMSAAEFLRGLPS